MTEWAKKKSWGIKCNRCGKCCWYKDVHGLWKPCRYLATDSRGYATCTRYHKRIGTHIGNGYYCVYRFDSGYNIPDCPFNMKGNMPHPFWGE